MKTGILISSFIACIIIVVSCSTQRSIADAASESRSLNNAGFAYMQGRDNMNAKTYLEKAIAIEPDLAVAHLNLGVVYQRIGYLSQAREQYLLAIANDASFENTIMIANADFGLQTVRGIANHKIAELP